jgi:hypothetical protein
MKKVLLALALFVFCSPAYSYDDKGYAGGYDIECDKVIEAHTRFTPDESSFSGSYRTHEVMGYIAGYITAKNTWKAGKEDWFKKTNPKVILPWVASYCRSNPSHTLDKALEIFSE